MAMQQDLQAHDKEGRNQRLSRSDNLEKKLPLQQK